jgi:N-acetylmuramoyl-L-alanine amidase
VPAKNTRRRIAVVEAPGGRWRRRRAWLAFLVVALLMAGAGVIVWRGLNGEPLGIFSNENGLPTVVVDAGHGGHDGGAARNGLLEKNLTLDTALRVEKKLRALGFPVVLTRRDDRFLELGERSDIANRIPRALFVSIHFNDNVAAVGEGVETYYAGEKVPVVQEGWSVAGLFRATPEPPPADNGMAFAETVQTSVVGALGATDRGVKSARYAVIRHTRCPAVLVEGGFINNPAQAKQIAQPAYREKLATAIAGAVEAYQHQRALDAKKPVLARAGR